MLVLLFILLMLMVFGKLLVFALRASWGIAKVLFSFVLLPVVLVGLVIVGLVYVALPVLIVIGVGALLLAKR